ncbi:MAG: hypothetical protein JW850_15165 [Thermoflexales bacterium]|nr:hypothetical protein [Thermoflexales bacterium]
MSREKRRHRRLNERVSAVEAAQHEYKDGHADIHRLEEEKQIANLLAAEKTHEATVAEMKHRLDTLNNNAETMRKQQEDHAKALERQQGTYVTKDSHDADMKGVERRFGEMTGRATTEALAVKMSAYDREFERLRLFESKVIIYAGIAGATVSLIIGAIYFVAGKLL